MTGTVARHASECWTGMVRNRWPAWTGIRTLGEIMPPNQTVPAAPQNLQAQ